MIRRYAKLWRHAVVGIALLMFAGAATAQNDNRSWLRAIPADGQSLKIERIEDIPQQLARPPGGCRIDQDLLSETPIAVFRPGRHSKAMVIVPCWSVVRYSRTYAVNPRGELTLLAFPIIEQDGSIIASDGPGHMEWDASTRTLTAFAGNDLGGGPVARYTYRFNDHSANGFALIKVERGTFQPGANQDLTVVWEAQPWGQQ